MKVKDWELDFSTKVGDRVKIIGTNTIGTIVEDKEDTQVIEVENHWCDYWKRRYTMTGEYKKDRLRKVVYFYLYRKEE